MKHWNESNISEAKLRLASKLKGRSGIQGFGVGADASGKPAILVFVTDESVLDRVPDKHENYPVVAKVTGLVWAIL